MRGQLSLEEQWNLFKPAWRIVVAIVMAQIVGAAVGLVIAPIGHPFLDLWYGGAYATPIGFVVGMFWMRAKGSMPHWSVLAILAVGSILLPLFGLLTRDMWTLALAAQAQMLPLGPGPSNKRQ